MPIDRDEAELAREAPVNVSLSMSPEQFARWEALWEKMQKLGGVKGADEMLEALAGLVVVKRNWLASSEAIQNR